MNKSLFLLFFPILILGIAHTNIIAMDTMDDFLDIENDTFEKFETPRKRFHKAPSDSSELYTTHPLINSLIDLDNNTKNVYGIKSLKPAIEALKSEDYVLVEQLLIKHLKKLKSREKFNSDDEFLKIRYSIIEAERLLTDFFTPYANAARYEQVIKQTSLSPQDEDDSVFF